MPQQQSVVKPEHLMKKLPGRNYKGMLLSFVAVVLVVLAGVGTGWVLARGGAGGGNKTASKVPVVTETETGEAGMMDEDTFSETAEGVLEKGGIEGEGAYHIKRGEDPIHTVYLTSTVIDLERYVGKKVQVWGETLGAKYAPWLMDVGRIKEL